MKKKKKGIKYWIGKLHLWLGLASGIVVLFLSVTGCIYVFSQEITNALRKEAKYVSEIQDNTIPVSSLWETAQESLGSQIQISSVNVYNDPEKAWVFYCYKASGAQSIWYLNNLDYYQSVYVDPYTGKILETYNEKTDFFNIIKMLHWSLLLETEIGQPIIGWATFIFVIMLITGLVLWWPKNKAARKQRFSFKWKDSTQWKRKNYDIHNIFGFYIFSIALVIAFTGMVWAFTWFQSIVYVAGSGTTTPPDIKYEKSVFADLEIAAIDSAFATSKSRYRSADAFRLSLPSDSTGVIQSYIQQHEGVYYVAHNLQFDQYSGKLLVERKHDEKNFGEKLITANYDIHVGAILGLPGKIMAFLASLTCGILPVTGFMIWYGRTFKKKNKVTKDYSLLQSIPK